MNWVFGSKNYELSRVKIAVEFAKFGFGGTLAGAIVGLLVVLSLAVLNAFTPARIETWGLVAITGMVVVVTVAHGYFSLWQAPRIFARFERGAAQIEFERAKRRESKSPDAG